MSFVFCGEAGRELRDSTCCAQISAHFTLTFLHAATQADKVKDIVRKGK